MKLLTLLGTLLAASLARAFSNPVIWNDLADLDIRRVNSSYYYSASTMAYSPGAPILKSGDLVNWQYIGHSVPSLDFGPQYNMQGGRAYVKGIWASFFGYHPQKNTWFWGGCIEFGKSYIYSAPSVTGPWTQLATFNKCYYDCGMLVDDDGTMYVSYASNNEVWVAQLSADAKTEVKSQMVFNPPSSIGYLEGTRMYKRNGKYYILATHPATAEWTLMASSPFGTYTSKVLANAVTPPSTTGGGNPHQGGLVDTPSGNWYYMAFVDNYPGGRMPVLAPVTWGSDGFPTLQLSGGAWGASYPDPVSPEVPVPPLTGVDYFTGSALGPQWEWNHNPDTTKFSVGNGLVLNTATVTTDLYSARNTLGHRILGPISTGTIKVLYGNMHDGDRAGLAAFRDQSAWIGVSRDSGAYTVRMVSGINMNTNWTTTATGATVASASISGGTIWLRMTADIRVSGAKTATFSYSTDGSTFHALGSALAFNTDWQFFLGYRFGIFNYATSALGGQVTISEFQLDSGSGSTPSPVPSTSGSSPTSSPATTTYTPTSSPTSSSPTTSPTGGNCAALYGQCGGLGWQGASCCSSGTCTFSNTYYSQCV